MAINRFGKFAWWVDFVLNVVFFWAIIPWDGIVGYFRNMKDLVGRFPSKNKISENVEVSEEYPYSSKAEDFDSLPEDEQEG